LVVPYEEGWWRRKLVLIKAADLVEELQVPSDAVQKHLSDDHKGIFPSAG
jgi:plasmid maintenance system killer protein